MRLELPNVLFLKHNDTNYDNLMSDLKSAGNRSMHNTFNNEYLRISYRFCITIFTKSSRKNTVTFSL